VATNTLSHTEGDFAPGVTRGATPANPGKATKLFKAAKYTTVLILLFLLSLPLSNPWVRGDGVGYYAYARAVLIEHRLDFTRDWQHGNESFVMGRVDRYGRVRPQQYTATGHLINLWAVGPSILWAPFLLLTHLGVRLCNQLGAHIPADGFSLPYVTTMALATSLYGFLGLWISFNLARKYFAERWAFLATIGVWWASSLPVYMYFNPSWSHAHSAFTVALFLWYWHRTRAERTAGQWIVLGLLSGLMVNVYYPNGVFLLIPLLEAVQVYWRMWKRAPQESRPVLRTFATHLAYFVTFLVAMLPTFITRWIIFGHPLRTGYMGASDWDWSSPDFWNVLWSSDHGLLIWTPIIILALIGLALFGRADKAFAGYVITAAVAFYVVIAFYPDWDGLSSFGNRFFISLTPVFLLGLAAFFDALGRVWQERRAAIAASVATAVFIIWNLGLIFQWGMHLIPPRGSVSWRVAAYNQVAVVPARAVSSLEKYFTRRQKLMDTIEQTDVKQIKTGQTSP